MPGSPSPPAGSWEIGFNLDVENQNEHAMANMSLKFVLQTISTATDFAFGMHVHPRVAANLRTNLHSESIRRHSHADSSENV